MARGNPQASGAAGQANSNSNAFFGNASSLYGNVAPMLESQAAHPAGFSPADESAMETGAMQTAGGSEAGAVGEGNLTAARTRNEGGFGQAISDASRGAGETLSRGLLGVRNANAGLKQHQHDEALSGLEGLTNTETSASNQALGNVAPLVNANTQAENASWNWLQPLNTIASLGSAAANSYKAYK